MPILAVAKADNSNLYALMCRLSYFFIVIQNSRYRTQRHSRQHCHILIFVTVFFPGMAATCSLQPCLQTLLSL